MHSRRILLSMVMLAVAISAVLGIAIAQEAGGPGDRGGRGRFDPEQMRRSYMDGVKQALGATDEEWTVLEPKITEVSNLSRQLSASGMRMGFGRGRGGDRGGGPGGTQATATEQTEIEKALADLQATLDNNEATPDEINAKLTALRAAREKARQELVKAQDALRQIVTLRQEAQLVLFGILE